MRRSVVLLSGVLALAGCAAGANPGTTAPAGSGVPGTVVRSCAEPVPDRGPVDLREVTVAPAGRGLTATFALATPPSDAAGVLELSLGIWGADGAAERSLEVRWVGGVPRVRIYDVVDGHEQELTVRPAVAGRTVTVRFPAAATAGLGRSWRWEAFATVDGTDVDDCP